MHNETEGGQEHVGVKAEQLAKVSNRHQLREPAQLKNNHQQKELEQPAQVTNYQQQSQVEHRARSTLMLMEMVMMGINLTNQVLWIPLP